MTETPSAQPETVEAAEITPSDMPCPTLPAPEASSPPAPAAAAPAPVDGPAPAATGEVDAAGVPFDPSRHNHVKNSKTGRWMLRPFRKPASTATPGAGSFIPKEEPPAAAPEPAAGGPAPESAAPVPDHSSDAAEVVCRATQFGVGLVFDAPEDCTPSTAEHRHMVEAVAAYIRAKGWTTAAGLGLLLMFTAWLLKVFQQPKPREKIRSWIGDGRADRAKDVTPPGSRPGTAAAAENGAAGPVVIDVPPGIPPLASS